MGFTYIRISEVIRLAYVRITEGWEIPNRPVYFPYKYFSRKDLVGPGGFEPPTPRLSAGCSTWLSYGPLVQGVIDV